MGKKMEDKERNELAGEGMVLVECMEDQLADLSEILETLEITTVNEVTELFDEVTNLLVGFMEATK